MGELGAWKSYEGRVGRIYTRCGGYVARSGIGSLRRHSKGKGWMLATENMKARAGTSL
jgi:hypothetical protein